MLDLDTIDFAKGGGLVPVVAQHARTNAVLMVAYADKKALEESLGTGEMHFFSRKRGLWRKGETSGHILRVVELLADCDRDTVLARVEPFGPACHTGQTTCFGEPPLDALRKLETIILRRATKPEDPSAPPSYTRKLLADRNLRLKKLGEESTELAVALADGDDKARIAEEAADVVYHVMVALQAAGVPFDEVRRALDERAK
ncbi:MAG: bifunctional phosphoribosyl-AMP cyclohydrolase/phosphoribosyl-ATP diphosphatase HisIE [Polyangiaceae bacterium]|jgi:phosphoribosyl-ATP pyrophosphohydrolase/phosphoribosyl-AMP cyclohydrolase|nr:bifunctional phosphoribosyl-AMP cyclohydrolase/phosphoribosyl-ATP diphosphatase HisIE [Polyangiaceae bacterium]MBK8941891.1 bifunctional phosphoribosyl-AMP cyclohydrolase/phosphoribosyl-ATP diphosphatase HisIE [Polyangiaceae bacterium]